MDQCCIDGQELSLSKPRTGRTRQGANGSTGLGVGVELGWEGGRGYGALITSLPSNHPLHIQTLFYKIGGRGRAWVGRGIEPITVLEVNSGDY